MFRETYSIKDKTFDPDSVSKLLANLHLTRKQFLLFLEILKLIKKTYDNISKTLFIPYSITKLVKTPQQKPLFFYFFKDFQSSKSYLMRSGIRFLEICFKNFINFDLFSQIYIKIRELDFFLSNHQILNGFVKMLFY